ncbi:MAG: PQQ-binding-like beta-propeller repeat protein [Planctomycetales bacterium]|nr:PQQ-binding-like beta-propeller repeat protein [Planctomycetales bacterium]
MQRLISRVVLMSLLLSVTTAQADWTQFRGSQARSVSGSDTKVPLEWDTSAQRNVAWRADLVGRGPSGPIVVDNRVYVTSSSGYKQDRLHVLCYDATNGKQLWHRQFWATGRTMTHPSSANAAPTPASDGESIYAFYSSNDLICLDLDGNLRWYRGLAYDFPKAGNDVGMASSPAVADGVVVVQVENQGDSFAAGIDTKTGKTLWQFERSKRANWSSPVIAKLPAGQALALFKSGSGLDAHDLHTGERRWQFAGDAGGISSVAVLDDKVILPFNGLVSLDITKPSQTPEVVWTSNRVNPGSASPVVSDEHVYAINGAGVLVCADLKSGEVLWQVRLQGKFWATPVLVDDHLFCINESGLAQVVKVGDKGEIVAKNEFGETIQGSPAVDGGALFVRSDQSLWKIAQVKDVDSP